MIYDELRTFWRKCRVSAQSNIACLLFYMLLDSSMTMVMVSMTAACHY